jgi:quinol monooxygenase YgiN
MATFLAHIRVRPGREPDFEQIVAELSRGTHEHEPNVRYEYWRGAAPSSYYALASFESFDAFLAHQTSDHHESAAPALRDVIETMRLEWLDPVAGASEAAVTDVGPLPAGASELAASYYARFAGDVVAGWWPPRP